MSGIKTCRLSREQFVGWTAEAVSGLPTLPRESGLQKPKADDVTLAWPQGRSDARPVVCLPEKHLQDFYAFISTYNAAVRPYTAYFRVIPLELVEILGPRELNHHRKLRLARMVAGSSIAEAWLSAARQADRPSNALPLLQSSLSAALGQAVLAGYGGAAFDWVMQEWMAIQVGQRNFMRDQNAFPISRAWLHIMEATSAPLPKFSDNNDKLITAFISKAVDEGSIRPELLSSLSVISGSELDLSKMLAAPREERITRFNATLTDLKRRDEKGLRAEFLAGLMLAIAGNGSFEMLRSAREFDGWLDGAATWFGVCAALFDESNVLAYAHSAGRRVTRDLLKPDDPFGLPSADIASTELRFLDHNQLNASQISARESGSIDVEILPNVMTRISVREAGQSARRFDESEMLLRTLDDVSELVNRARRLLHDRDVSNFQGDPHKPRGRSRFKS